MKCILVGHRWQEREGQGAYAGQLLEWCPECNKTRPAETTDLLALAEAFDKDLSHGAA